MQCALIVIVHRDRTLREAKCCSGIAMLSFAQMTISDEAQHKKTIGAHGHS
jgi:hypothetical protein